MKLSEFAGKEIVNIFDGARLGTVRESDLIIDALSGSVESIVLPGRSSSLSLRTRGYPLMIPWQAVRKIGSQIIIIDLELNRVKRSSLLTRRRQTLTRS